jgi:hypothetical protein
MSRALNYSHIHLPASHQGLRTVKGNDHLNYAYAVQELHAWMKWKFGPADIRVRGKPVSRDRFLNKKGVIFFDIVFGLNADHRTRALGHADLWDGRTFYDEIAGISSSDHDFFKMADAVSLWIAEGTTSLIAAP